MSLANLKEVVAVLDNAGALGVLLTGSRAWHEHHASGRGDTDLYVLMSRPADRVRLSTALDPWPSVHASFFTASAAGRLPPTFRLFEARTGGEPLSGQDIRPLLPQVSVQNLDYGDVNDVLSWRILSVMNAQASRVSREQRSYLAAKNRLDLGIWLGCQVGILDYSHRNRIQALRELERGAAVSDELWALLVEWTSDIGEAYQVKLGKHAFANADRELEISGRLLLRAAELTLSERVAQSRLSDRRVRRRLGVVRNLLVDRPRLPLREWTALMMHPHRHLLTLAAEAVHDRGRLPQLARVHGVVYRGAVE